MIYESELGAEKYLFDLELARVVFKKEKGLLSKLDGIGNRKDTLSGWLKQVKVFYTNALAEDEILEKLKNFGLTGEKLTAGKEMADQLDQAVARREARRGEVRQ